MHQLFDRSSGDNVNVEEMKGHNNDNDNNSPPPYEKLERRVLERTANHWSFSWQIICLTRTLFFWAVTLLQTLVLIYLNFLFIKTNKGLFYLHGLHGQQPRTHHKTVFAIPFDEAVPMYEIVHVVKTHYIERKGKILKRSLCNLFDTASILLVLLCILCG